MGQTQLMWTVLIAGLRVSTGSCICGVLRTGDSKIAEQDHSRSESKTKSSKESDFSPVFFHMQIHMLGDGCANTGFLGYCSQISLAAADNSCSVRLLFSAEVDESCSDPAEERTMRSHNPKHTHHPPPIPSLPPYKFILTRNTETHRPTPPHHQLQNQAMKLFMVQVQKSREGQYGEQT